MVKKKAKKPAKKPVKKPAAKAAVKAAKPLKAPAKKGHKYKKGEPQIAYLGMGSNVGDREEYIEQAVFLLGKVKGIDILKRSTNHETEAEGGGEQPAFINAAVMIRTTLSPHELLEKIQEIETALGREREVEWGPRTIDIDILMYSDQVISDDKLQIPHPLMHDRMFVLLPLKEIAPRAIHPMLEKTVEDLYEDKKNEAGEKYDDELPGFKEIKTRGGYDDFERW
ncbi:MAG TPA: 2-amino-4-hydroxy-6-hydroxymethyldihydropteridine diphosphokinase [Candidatus Omnitrophota bacterium]|nr:2-amino-4-hydroxy-6-hydroxymethyldihydropteridine diphosphokinase [Candidatus Omnitrophota bacterium]